MSKRVSHQEFADLLTFMKQPVPSLHLDTPQEQAIERLEEWELVCRRRGRERRWGEKMCALAQCFQPDAVAAGGDNQTPAAIASYRAICEALRPHSAPPRKPHRRHRKNRRPPWGYAIDSIESELVELRWFLGQLARVSRTDHRQPYACIRKNASDVERSEFWLEWRPIHDRIKNDPYRSTMMDVEATLEPAAGGVHWVTVLKVRPAFPDVFDPYDSTNAEVVGRLVGPFVRWTSEAVRAQGGKVYGGCGEVVSVFGQDNSPSKHGAIAAVTAAIAIRQQAQLSDAIDLPVGKTRLSVRIGIHTHAAWSESTGETELDCGPYTSAVCAADELLRSAALNCIVVSDATYALIREEFNCDEARSITLALGTRPSLNSMIVLDKKTDRGKTSPSVGRLNELSQLREMWNTQPASRRFVWVKGEQGIGKSRMLRDLSRDITGRHDEQSIGENEDRWALRIECHQHRQQHQLFAVVNTFASAFRWKLPASRASRKGFREQLQARSVEWHDDYHHLLDGAGKHLAGASECDPHTIAAFHRLIMALAQTRPLLLIVDDAHSADSATVNLLKRIDDSLSDDTPAGQILPIVAFDPCQTMPPPWAQGVQHMTIELNPLAEPEVRNLAKALFRRKMTAAQFDMTSDELDVLFSRLIEPTLAQVGGNPKKIGAAIVREVQNLKAQRNEIDLRERLATFGKAEGYYPALFVRRLLHSNQSALDLLALSAVLGFRFSRSLIREAARSRGMTFSGEQLDGLLKYLCDKDFLTEFKSDTFEFVDNFTFQGARGLTPNLADPALNADVAQAYSRLESSLVHFHHGIIGAHFAVAGSSFRKQAVEAWHLAGRRILDSNRRNMGKALAYFTVAEQLCVSQPTNKADIQQRIHLLTDMLVPLLAHSYVSPELTATMDEIRRYRDVVEEHAVEFKIERANWSIAHNLNNLGRAREHAEQMESLAERLLQTNQQKEFLVEAYHVASVTFYCLGRFDKALTMQQKVVALCEDEESIRESVLAYSDHDPAPCCAILGACSSWFLNRAKQSRELLQHALELVRRRPHRLTEAIVNCYAAKLFWLQSKFRQSLDHAHKAAKIADQIEVRRWQAMASILSAAAEAELATNAELADQRYSRKLRAGIDLWQRNGERTYGTFWNAVLARVLIREQKLQDALGCVDAAIRVAVPGSEEFFLPELFRIRHLLLRDVDPKAAEQSLENARAVADRLGAKALLERCERADHLR